MIVTDLAGLERQAALIPGLQEGLAFLRQMGAEDLLDGARDIAGGRIHVLVRSYAALPGAPLSFEGHRNVVELQYVASGEMMLGWAPSACAAVTRPYDPGQDSWLGAVPADRISRVLVQAGQVAVFYPEDAHALGPTPGGQVIKKVTLKIELGA